MKRAGVPTPMVDPKFERIGGIALIVLGVLFYLFFGILQGSPTDVGVYAITIVPLVLGLAFVWRASGDGAGQ